MTNSIKLGTTICSIFAAGAISLIGLIGCGGMEGDLAGEEEAPVAENEQAIFGSDACKNIDITITNSFEDGTRACDILVRKVEIYSASEGRYLTEDLANFEINYGSSHTWWNEDLQYAENDTLTAIRVYFSYVESDGDWSDTVYQYIDITNDVCHEDDNYSVTVN